MATNFSTIEECIQVFRSGKMLIVMDDEDRENEGDLFLPAQFATEEKIKFFLNHTTGILCTAMPEEWATQLSLPLMVQENTDPNKTAFTVTCDHVDAGTGVSAAHRARTIVALADPSTEPAHLRRPGHVFPLISKPGGVLQRRGHTEACVDMCKLAGVRPVGLLSELCHDGAMLRLPQCAELARKYNIPIFTIDQLVKFREQSENCTSEIPTSIKAGTYVPVEEVARCELPVEFDGKSLGTWDMRVFTNLNDRLSHTVLVKGDVSSSKGPILARVHSECFTGNTLGSLRCDCGPQLRRAFEVIANEGTGVIIWVTGHEGRGIGLVNKARAYNLQTSQCIDTYEANSRLGFPADLRKYDAPLAILRSLGIKQIELLTNNSDKHQALEELVVAVRPLNAEPNIHNEKYLAVKRLREEEARKNRPSSPQQKRLEVAQQEPLSSDKQASTKIEHSKEAKLSVPIPEIARKMRIGLIHTNWNTSLVEPLVESCRQMFISSCVKPENIVTVAVPGSFELPMGAQMLAETNSVDAILCIGVLIKGDTIHFEMIAQSCSTGLMKVQLKTGIPVLNGVLTCLTVEQAETRAIGPNNLSPSLSLSCMNMAALRMHMNTGTLQKRVQNMVIVQQPCTDLQTEVQGPVKVTTVPTNDLAGFEVRAQITGQETM